MAQVTEFLPPMQETNLYSWLPAIEGIWKLNQWMGTSFLSLFCLPPHSPSCVSTSKFKTKEQELKDVQPMKLTHQQLDRKMSSHIGLPSRILESPGSILTHERL